MPLQTLLNLKEKCKIDYNYIIDHDNTIIDFNDESNADINISYSFLG